MVSDESSAGHDDEEDDQWDQVGEFRHGYAMVWVLEQAVVVFGRTMARMEDRVELSVVGETLLDRVSERVVAWAEPHLSSSPVGN